MNITELLEQLQSIKRRSDTTVDHLKREKNYILEIQNKVQASFGDQSVGQQIVTQLYVVNNILNCAESAFQNMNMQIDNYMIQVRK